MGSEPMRTQDLDDRLETLETGFAELRAQNATIMQQLSQLLVKFENNTNSITTAAPNSKSPDDKLKPSNSPGQFSQLNYSKNWKCPVYLSPGIAGGQVN